MESGLRDMSASYSRGYGSGHGSGHGHGASITITRALPPAGAEALDGAGARYSVLQQDGGAAVPRDRLLHAAARADVLLTLLTERIDAELLESAPRLRGVASMAVGYNNIDVAAATRLGIPVTNTPGVLTETTADLTWALLLGAARRIAEGHAFLTGGHFRIWGPQLLLGADVGPGPDGRRKTLGIIGFGRIGQAVARRARGFDMRVLAYNPRSRDAIHAADGVEFADVGTILESSDFVTLHAAYSAETHHLIDERTLRRMKQTAYLVNVARGEMVDEQALVHALREGWIAGAGLDVFEREPELAEGLASCSNAVLLPHIGSASHDTRGSMAATAAANAIAHLRLQPAPNVLNREVYDSAAYRDRLARIGAADAGGAS
jgi:glyoxylate reductase